MKVVEKLGGERSRLEPNVFFSSSSSFLKENKLNGICFDRYLPWNNNSIYPLLTEGFGCYFKAKNQRLSWSGGAPLQTPPPPLYRGMCRHRASNHRIVNIFVRAVNCLRFSLCCVCDYNVDRWLDSDSDASLD